MAEILLNYLELELVQDQLEVELPTREMISESLYYLRIEKKFLLIIKSLVKREVLLNEMNI